MSLSLDFSLCSQNELRSVVFLAFKSQGRVWLLSWQTDDFSSLKQLEQSYIQSRLAKLALFFSVVNRQLC